MISLRLFLSVSTSHLRRERLKTMLSVLGMALGIAVFFAIQTAIANAWDGFVSSTKLLAPDERLRLESSSGEIPESLIPAILNLNDLVQLSPQSSRFVDAYSGEQHLGTVQVLGIDPLGSSQNGSLPNGLDILRVENAALVSSELSAHIQHGVLSIVANGKKHDLKRVGALPANGLAQAFGGQMIVVDIATFQDLFETWGKIDRLFVSFPPSRERHEIEADIRAKLPNFISLANPDDNTRHAKKMSESFRLNLSFLAAISLFVALFLVYNTTSYSTLKRRGELSILRSLGTSQTQLFTFLSLENILLGLLSAILGISLGSILALGAVKIVSLSFSTLYLPVHVTKVSWRSELFLECLLLGPLLSFLGGLIPITEVVRMAPRQTMYYEQAEGAFRSKIKYFSSIGALLLLAAGISALKPLLDKNIYAGFLSPSFLLLGTAFIVPLFLLLAIMLMRRLFSELMQTELLLALDHIETTLRRSSMAISAIVIATGMFIGLSIMILSFRQTVNDWITHITKADIYVSNQSQVAGPSSGYLPAEVVEYLKNRPDVVDYDWIAGTKIRVADREVRVNGMRYDILARHDRLLFKRPMSAEAIRQMTEDPVNILVSETFASRNGVAIGDHFNLPSLNGSSTVKVANIFYDYSSDQGVLLIPDILFTQLYSEPRKQGVSLYLSPNADAEGVRQDIAERFPELALSVRSNKSLRQEVLKVFDDTFRITYALQGIALLISSLTMLNTVLMLMLERKREFSVLRAIGASRFSISMMAGYESFFLGFLALCGALVLGFLLSLILVFVINQFFFGWSVRFVLPVGMLFSTSTLVLCMSVICGVFPGFVAAKKIDIGSLNYE